MDLSVAAAALIAAAVMATSSDPVAIPAECPDPGPAEPARPCAPGTPEHADAARALAALSSRIARLGSAPGDLEAANRALSSLLSSKCFALSEENPRELVAATPLSLRTWWKDGGEEWLATYLRLGDPGCDPRERHVILPPDMRPGVSLSPSAARALVCKDDDEGCDAETRGWQLRADRALEALQAAEEADDRSGPRPGEGRDTEETCRERAGAATGSYGDWRACIEAIRRTRPALPLGRLRAPRRGWFVIGGRRGHHQFCDELRAYDLETGAAFVARSCSGLALQPGGAVDHAATDEARRLRSLSGRVSVDNLREAVWMSLLAKQVAAAQVYGQYFRVPEGMAIERLPGSDRGGLRFGSLWGSSDQTELTWRWIDRGQLLAEGDLTWPRSCELGEDHAAALLDIAEASWVDGPPATKIPGWALAPPRVGGVSRLDARREDLERTQTALLEELRRFAASGATGRRAR